MFVTISEDYLATNPYWKRTEYSNRQMWLATEAVCSMSALENGNTRIFMYDNNYFDVEEQILSLVARVSKHD